jgi:hypothetical protein
MRPRSLPRRVLGALAGDALVIGLCLPGGALAGLVVAPVLAVGTVWLAGLARGQGVGDGR